MAVLGGVCMWLCSEVCACGCVGRCVHVAVLGGKGLGKEKLCACNHVTCDQHMTCLALFQRLLLCS